MAAPCCLHRQCGPPLPTHGKKGVIPFPRPPVDLIPFRNDHVRLANVKPSTISKMVPFVNINKMSVYHLCQDFPHQKNHITSCLILRERVQRILGPSSGLSNLLLILPDVNGYCDLFSKRKDALLGWSLTVPAVSVLTDDLIHRDNFFVPPKLYVTETRNSYCKGLSRCCQEKENVVTVLPEKRDCLMSDTESTHPPLRAYSLR